MRGENLGTLSPSALDYYGTTKGLSTGWQREYHAAGSELIAIGYLTSIHGAKSILSNPVTDDVNLAKVNYDNSDPIVSSHNIINLTPPKTTDKKSIEYRNTIKSAIYNYAAVNAAIKYESNFNTSNKTSYYYNSSKDPSFDPKTNGHSICIVGWDDNYSKDNFLESCRPTKDGAWYCKNSWGPQWSQDDGYFYISYEDDMIFSGEIAQTYCFCDYITPKNKKLYEVEDCGANDYSLIKLSSESQVVIPTYVNIFDIEQDDYVADRVTFKTNDIGAKFNIYYIPVLENTNPDIKYQYLPDSNKDNWVLLKSGTIEYEGYHSFAVDKKNYKFENNPTKVAIGISIQYDDQEKVTHLGITKPITISGTGKYLLNPKVQPEKSFIIGRSETDPINLTDIYASQTTLKDGTNFVIKLITKSPKANIYGDANLDFNVTIEDVSTIQQYLAVKTYLDKVQLKCAHCTKEQDRAVSVIDATLIQQYLAHLQSDDSIIGKEIKN